MIGMLLTVFIGIGALFAMPQFFGSIGGGIGDFFVILGRGIVYILVLVLPIGAAVVPLYFIAKRKMSPNSIALSMIYGLVLFFVMWEFGFMAFAVENLNHLTGSWFEPVMSGLYYVFVVLEGFVLRIGDIVFGSLLHPRRTFRNLFRRGRHFQAKYGSRYK